MAKRKTNKTRQRPENRASKPSSASAGSAGPREKAAFMIGMVRAFERTRWPSHFDEEDKSQWRTLAGLAYQMINGGVWNPLHVLSVTSWYDDETGMEL